MSFKENLISFIDKRYKYITINDLNINNRRKLIKFLNKENIIYASQVSKYSIYSLERRHYNIYGENTAINIDLHSLKKYIISNKSTFEVLSYSDINSFTMKDKNVLKFNSFNSFLIAVQNTLNSIENNLNLLINKFKDV